MKTVNINLGERSYEVRIACGLLDDEAARCGWGDWAAGVAGADRGGARRTAVIVSNEVVAPLYAQRLRAAMQPHFRRIEAVVLPDGEAHKDWPALNRIFDHLLAHGADRQTLLVALGGGVVGDVTGFAAACYMRGVPFVQVPTTLLAQVDSSVGGKTAINHPLGKNMIGAFHQPLRVLCDLDVLATLPPREVAAGLAEVIKYGPIADAAFLGWLEANVEKLLALDRSALAHAVARCCEIKAQVVGADEREGGLRAILNFGHTFGHAIEAGLGYGAWLHGEAVAAGMVMAAELSERLGTTASGLRQRLEALLARARLPLRGPRLGAAEYLRHMRIDKKAQGAEIRFVLIGAVGTALVRPAPDALVAEVVEALSA